MDRTDGFLDVLMHVPFEGPAAIADRALARGRVVREHHLFAQAPLPAIDDIEALVVMGGPMGALDDDACPWLPDVRRLLREAVHRGTPVLGVCLGAQLLAAACGSEVYTGPTPEIGPGTVRLHQAATTDPLLRVLEASELDVFHWHGDTFDLPDDATLLASSDRYPNQAFRIANAWGLQFHVELRATDATLVTSHLGEDRRVDATELAVIETDGTRIIDAFLDFGRRRARPE